MHGIGSSYLFSFASEQNFVVFNENIDILSFEAQQYLTEKAHHV